jgi:hypothetical protein
VIDSTAQAEEHDARVVEMARTGFEAVLWDESVDRAWEDRSRSQLQSLLATDELRGSTFDDVTCGETVCRLTLSHEDRAAYDRLMLGPSILKPPFNTEFFESYSEETQRTVVYLARRGESLPRSVLETLN